jgi:hypothetical protein
MFAIRRKTVAVILIYQRAHFYVLEITVQLISHNIPASTPAYAG